MADTRIRKRCNLCNIELDENNFESHMQGKKHLKNVGGEIYKKECIEKSIYVSRMPPDMTLDGIVTFFTQFGVVERCKLEPHFAILEFKKKETANFLLSRPIWMGSHKLDIKRRRWNNTNYKSIKKFKQDIEKSANEIIFADLKTKLLLQTTFEAELTIFLEDVLLDEKKVEKNWCFIKASLLEALKPSFPNCEISRFGSSSTGLCLKGSDIDIYLNIGVPIYEDNDKNLGWTPRTIFKEVKLLLYKRNNIFDQIVPIPKAKTPIIKFRHIPTVTNCDITFKNGLGVINSHLIKRLVSLDSRLKPLMIIIKFWAQSFELSGTGKFTHYAIIMMIIFYLQQPETRILPTIGELQKTCKPIYHWNWQVNFDRESILPVSTNHSSIAELLHGFFKFWDKFPFNEMLISPLNGCAYTRVDFEKLYIEKGGDANDLGLNRPICLQDPIELDYNITSGVSVKVLETFQIFCATAVEVCEAAKANEPFLLNLFTRLPVPLDNKAFQQITIMARKPLTAGLPEDFFTRTDIVDKDLFAETHWYDLAEKLVVDALRRVFKMDIRITKNDREVKQQKNGEISDVCLKNNEKIVLECTGNYCVIAGRKFKSFSIDPTLSHIDKEALISEEVVNKQKQEGVTPNKIDFTCKILRGQNPTRLVLELNNRNSAKKSFRESASFLSTKLPSIIDKELIHIIQYKKSDL